MGTETAYGPEGSARFAWHREALRRLAGVIGQLEPNLPPKSCRRSPGRVSLHLHCNQLHARWEYPVGVPGG